MVIVECGQNTVSSKSDAGERTSDTVYCSAKLEACFDPRRLELCSPLGQLKACSTTASSDETESLN